MKKPICEKCGGTIHGANCLLCEMFAAAESACGLATTTWPMESWALAVHPKQVGEANARAKRHGINVVYKKNGSVHIPDRAERKKLLRLEGFHDNNGGYGD